MTDERAFQPGKMIRIAFPGSAEDLQFVISDVRDDGGVETVSMIPDPENADLLRHGRSLRRSPGREPSGLWPGAGGVQDRLQLTALTCARYLSMRWPAPWSRAAPSPSPPAGTARCGCGTWTTRAPIGDPFTGHTGDVHAVACTVLDGHPIAVTAGGDAAVRFWDLRERREVERIDLPGVVRAIDVGAGNVIMAGFETEVLVLEPTGGRG